MSTPPQQAPAAGGGPKLKLNKNVLMAGGAVGVALLAFVMSRGSGGGGGGSIQPYDSTPYDQYGDLQDQLEDIQRQIDNGEVTPGTPTKPKPTPTSPKPKPTPSKPKPPTKPLPKPTPNHPPKPKTVTIQRGDTLSAIAKRAHISMATLKKLNPIFWTNKKYHDGNTIFAGGKVRVK